MQNHLAVTDREVTDLTALGEAIRLQVMPGLTTEIPLIKVNVEDYLLVTSFQYLASMLFLNICHIEEVQHAFWQEITCQYPIIKRRSFLSHGCKDKASITTGQHLGAKIRLPYQLLSTDFCR